MSPVMKVSSLIVSSWNCVVLALVKVSIGIGSVSLSRFIPHTLCIRLLLSIQLNKELCPTLLSPRIWTVLSPSIFHHNVLSPFRPNPYSKWMSRLTYPPDSFSRLIAPRLLHFWSSLSIFILPSIIQNLCRLVSIWDYLYGFRHLTGWIHLPYICLGGLYPPTTLNHPKNVSHFPD